VNEPETQVVEEVSPTQKLPVPAAKTIVKTIVQPKTEVVSPTTEVASPTTKVVSPTTEVISPTTEVISP
jgi:hypothetical protein